MKKSLIISAIAIGVYYLVRQLLGEKEETLGPPKKHLTDAFAKAKRHVISENEGAGEGMVM